MAEPHGSEDLLEAYLKETHPSDTWPRRTFCCESSRSLYCPECCTVCIPEEAFPLPLQDGRLRFTFSVDVILDVKERKTSSTGIQLVAVANALESRREELRMGKSETSVVLHDLGKSCFPEYNPEEEGVYVLFPSDDSVPISSVSPSKLVVLDIKWSKQMPVTAHPTIAQLPKVHLDSPPPQSHFWRWHNEGKGMLSTIEAVYYAAMEVTRDDNSWSEEARDDLIHMMWLFALQRSIIHSKSEMEKRVLPFTEEGKESQRVLRKQKENAPKKRIEANSSYDNLS
jgi:hypothetical protein